MKLWEAAERAYMDTFYGHNDSITGLSCIDGKNFVSSGYDKQVIYWKIADEQ